MLRKRLPPLEELRMDEEVATYTSVSVPAAPGFLPPRPRCGNPLASILHFEDSSVSTLLTVCMYRKKSIIGAMCNVFTLNHCHKSFESLTKTHANIC